MFRPGYLKLLDTGELKQRTSELKDMLNNCVLCPHQCEVNRVKGERGYCRTLYNPIISGVAPHFGEEDELVGKYGSGTIFFSHCNLKCVFCQNYEISFCGEGKETSIEKLAELMLYLQRKKCHNINLVSPGHIIPQIAEAIFIASQKGLKIPIVYNSNGYDLTDTLKLLEGIVDIYMPDIKFGDNKIGEKYLGAKSYYDIASSALIEMFRQVGNLKTENNIAYRGLMIRHLVMPQNLAQTEKIMSFIAENLSKETYVNIMPQYYPAHEAFGFKELSRRISDEEFRYAINTAKLAGLKSIRS